MTALADLLSTRDRARLLERLAELKGVDRMMREAGGLAEAPEPVPLHRASRGEATERTTS